MKTNNTCIRGVSRKELKRGGCSFINKIRIENLFNTQKYEKAERSEDNIAIRSN